MIALAEVKSDVMEAICVNDCEVPWGRPWVEATASGGVSQLYTEAEFFQCRWLKMSSGPPLNGVSVEIHGAKINR